MSTPFEPLASINKAAGDPLRLQILRVLRTESLGVLELCRVFGMSQPSMSHHLKVMLQAMLLTTRKEGNTVFYRRSLPQSPLVQALFSEIDQLPLPPEIESAFAEVAMARAQASRDFFSKHAKTLLKHQELIAEHQIYAQAMAELMEKSPFTERERVLEIGPGAGDFLPQLSARFETVYAVDNSEEMIRCGQQLTAQHGLSNVHFVHGEVAALSNMSGSFDAVVANMVLHHVPQPADIFTQVKQLLKTGGSFFISDLSLHQQDWVKASCGDVWLGFSAESLEQWAVQAGLHSGEAQYLGLRNGFQITVRRFYR